MLQRAESEIIRQRRELSIDGGIFVRKGDPADLTEESRRPWIWSSSKKVSFNFLPSLFDFPPFTRLKAKMASALLIQISLRSPVLPRLPNEILRAIAYECDTKTLTALSRTSFVWLEIATPILYESFTPRSRQDLENFVNPVSDPFVDTDLRISSS